MEILKERLVLADQPCSRLERAGKIVVENVMDLDEPGVKVRDIMAVIE